ncbi:MAG: fibronectin type III domain-containing protein, partial [Desulfobacterales bacterium]|nr:fibronectin type III domain-containing protein [Desulfobacterales bacterium]
MTPNSATLNGVVNPNSDNTTYYFEYGETISYGSASGGNAGSGYSDVAVNVGVSSLSPDTTYHFRIFAYNSMGTSYGDDVSFTTPQVVLQTPNVETTAPSSIMADSALAGGNILYDGGAPVTARGVCWSESADPTTNDSCTSDGSGNGAFSSVITGLAPDTLYHIRAYAENSVGVGYGDDIVFSTPSAGAPQKAIIVAGGGPYPGNTLWTATQLCSNFAYKALLDQGFTKETIHYLSPDLFVDVDGNGALDDVDEDATLDNLENALTDWALDAEDLFLYVTDHGGNGFFKMNETELLWAGDLDDWLDETQETVPGDVVLVYDACRS